MRKLQNLKILPSGSGGGISMERYRSVAAFSDFEPGEAFGSSNNFPQNSPLGMENECLRSDRDNLKVSMGNTICLYIRINE